MKILFSEIAFGQADVFNANAPLIVNPQAYGYYRVLYPKEHYNNIAALLKRNASVQ